MILNGNSFQKMLDATIQRDITSSMNPSIRAKHNAVLTIERYIESIPFMQNLHHPYYGLNAFADYQTVKEHFCTFWKRELGLSFAERAKLEEIFEQNILIVSTFASNTAYLVFSNENTMMSVQSMEEAIFDVLDLLQFHT